ncbi:hypothetical protein HY638_04680 [Candidatus Woesearchaeota archaeon]|nr:hypothetical protein [Candidatus Woesearchaeota archaeon]
MEQKRVFLGVLVIVSLLIIGCSGSKGNQPTAVEFRTGSSGLDVTFPSGTPQQIFENDIDVRIPIQVENKGAFPQFDELSEFTGFLWVGGYDPNILQASFEQGDIRKQLDPEELEGRSSFNQQGGVVLESLILSVGDLPLGTAVYEPTLIFYLTYLYKSIASVPVCIDPEPRSINVKDKVCSLTDFRKIYSVAPQGGPVGITNVEEIITSNQIIFKFDLQNFGTGQVIARDLVSSNPNEGFDWRDLNRVQIEDVRLGDRSVDKCKPDLGEEVELFQGIGHFQCTLSVASIASAQAYTTPLTVTLTYGYAQSQFRNIKILEAIEI